MTKINNDILLSTENILNVLQFFIPGFFTIKLFTYFTSTESKVSMNIMIFMSCAISYVYVILINYVSNLINIELEQSSMLFLSFIISILMAVFFYLIYNSSPFSWILLHLLHRTINNDDIFKDILDFKNGTNLNIHLKNKDYYIIGSYDMYNIVQKPSWLSLTHYKIISNEKEINTHSSDFSSEKDKTIMINLDEIDYIEKL
ncbi:hypothetical protein [Emergencia sp.]|uniref:hypothetical protein n=1 Tax=Emergencia sp. TaxID=1926557 RepID=UPI003AF17D7A